jgi:hypothetical protein
MSVTAFGSSADARFQQASQPSLLPLLKCPGGIAGVAGEIADKFDRIQSYFMLLFQKQDWV